MNTKGSAVIGWAAYVSAFAIGGGIGIYKFWYSPGGRLDRELEADRKRELEAAREAEDETRIREERRILKQKENELQQLSTSTVDIDQGRNGVTVVPSPKQTGDKELATPGR